MAKLNIAIVLTGGGARAAYQVGALQALAKAPVNCTAVSGVGAGALNGLIVAAAHDLTTAHEQLERFWANAVLAPQSALQIGAVPVAQLGLYLTLLYAGGADPMLHEVLKGAGRGAARARQARAVASLPTNKLDVLIKMIEVGANMLNVSTDANLDARLSSRLGAAANAIRRPFFVSTFRSGTGYFEQLKLMLQGAGMLSPGAPSFIPVHEIAAEERLSAVLASASLPFACGPREVGGTVLIDGSYGGLSSSAGAVPVSPLLHLAGIDAIVVIHTDLASPFDASMTRGVPIFEIKPMLPPDAAEVGYFWADAAALGHWIDQGRRDTEQQIGAMIDELANATASKRAHSIARAASAALDELD